MKRYKTVFILLFLFLLITLFLLAVLRNKKNKGDDYKIGVFADDGVALISISKTRNMINFLKVSPEAKIWIPGGMGWYRSGVVKKILTQENRNDLYQDILFYNFGFMADKTVSLKKVDNWRNKFWLRVKLNSLINKDEIMENDSDTESDWLNEIMLRDFSESKVFDEDLKISITNISKENGLASFVTDNLERLGFSIISVSTGENSDMDECTILYGDGVEKTYSWDLLKSLFGKNCKMSKDISLNNGEIELYFDDKFASMIKYSSYKK